jgi:tripartite-type tricarboxylate transporter receptor subunit TctC
MKISSQKCRFWMGKLLVFILIISVIGLDKQAQSQEKYPTRPIDIIVGFSPGGGTDSTTRLIAEYLKKKWNVPLNVINKPGGGTVPASLDVYAATPNGYTMLADTESCSALVGLTMAELPFKVLDRTFVGTFCLAPLFFMVPAASPYRSLADAMADAKKDPSQFTWVSGAGNHDWLFRQFFRIAGVDVSKTQVVLVKGGAKSVAMVGGGHVKIGASPVVTSRALAQAGAIRYLAVSGDKRNPEFPGVPTTAELGYPTINAVNWTGFSGPPKLPTYIVNIWEKTLKEISEDLEFVSRLNKMGFTTFYLNSAGMRDFVMKQVEEVGVLFEKK